MEERKALGLTDEPVDKVRLAAGRSFVLESVIYSANDGQIFIEK